MHPIVKKEFAVLAGIIGVILAVHASDKRAYANAIYDQPKALWHGTVLSGRVISYEEKAPLEGVTVQVKDTRNISGTLFDGMYAIEIRPVDSVLVFSYEGYDTVEVKLVADRTEYNVLLKHRQSAFVTTD